MEQNVSGGRGWYSGEKKSCIGFEGVPLDRLLENRDIVTATDVSKIFLLYGKEK